MKFIIMGPVSLILVLRARLREAGARRRDRTRETLSRTLRQEEPIIYVAAR
ncbi:hypothetical protein GCM10022231_17320 [Gordonia caeni]|uniref:Uncharacterized protein n=1 Tax=Gordonia caeni TaxID=1007097 RepID=A0ABP7P329_9ACTN